MNEHATYEQNDAQLEPAQIDQAKKEVADFLRDVDSHQAQYRPISLSLRAKMNTLRTVAGVEKNDREYWKQIGGAFDKTKREFVRDNIDPYKSSAALGTDPARLATLGATRENAQHLSDEQLAVFASIQRSIRNDDFNRRWKKFADEELATRSALRGGHQNFNGIKTGEDEWEVRYKDIKVSVIKDGDRYSVRVPSKDGEGKVVATLANESEAMDRAWQEAQKNKYSGLRGERFNAGVDAEASDDEKRSEDPAMALLRDENQLLKEQVAALRRRLGEDGAGRSALGGPDTHAAAAGAGTTGHDAPAVHSATGHDTHDTGHGAGGHEMGSDVEIKSRADFRKHIIGDMFKAKGYELPGGVDRAEKWLQGMPRWKRLTMFATLGIAAAAVGALAAAYVTPLAVAQMGVTSLAGKFATALAVGIPTGMVANMGLNKVADKFAGLPGISALERAKMAAGYDKSLKMWNKHEKRLLRAGGKERAHLAAALKQHEKTAHKLGASFDRSQYAFDANKFAPSMSKNELMARYEQAYNRQKWVSIGVRSLMGGLFGLGVADWRAGGLFDHGAGKGLGRVWTDAAAHLSAPRSAPSGSGAATLVSPAPRGGVVVPDVPPPGGGRTIAETAAAAHADPRLESALADAQAKIRSLEVQVQQASSLGASNYADLNAQLQTMYAENARIKAELASSLRTGSHPAGGRPRLGVEIHGSERTVSLAEHWQQNGGKIRSLMHLSSTDCSQGTVHSIQTVLHKYGINVPNNSRLVSLLDAYLDPRGVGGRQLLGGSDSSRHLLQIMGAPSGDATRISGGLKMEYLFGNERVMRDLEERLTRQLGPRAASEFINGGNGHAGLKHIFTHARLLIANK